ncbi:MAG: hypothetical protein NDI90_06270 [Nitrospira sp. BO4]|nr:hypothetical protein [Nitrospira sp. BO4]
MHGTCTSVYRQKWEFPVGKSLASVEEFPKITCDGMRTASRTIRWRSRAEVSVDCRQLRDQHPDPLAKYDGIAGNNDLHAESSGARPLRSRTTGNPTDSM